jgi:putative transposase
LAKMTFYKIAGRFDFEIDTIGITDGHVELILCAFLRYSSIRIVHFIKSIADKMMFKQFPEVKGQLSGGEVWDEYFVQFVGDKCHT